MSPLPLGIPAEAKDVPQDICRRTLAGQDARDRGSPRVERGWSETQGKQAAWHCAEPLASQTSSFLNLVPFTQRWVPQEPRTEPSSLSTWTGYTLYLHFIHLSHKLSLIFHEEGRYHVSGSGRLPCPPALTADPPGPDPAIPPRQCGGHWPFRTPSLAKASATLLWSYIVTTLAAAFQDNWLPLQCYAFYFIYLKSIILEPAWDAELSHFLQCVYFLTGALVQVLSPCF